MNIKPHLKQVRRFSQLVCLAIFLVLFRLTDYTGSDSIPYAVNILFRMDPLVLLAITLAKKTFVFLLWPSFIIILLTLLFGRAFCSWMCPLGTIIDVFGRFIPRGTTLVRLAYLKYGILAMVLISAFFGVQLVGFVDPFSLLVRGMVFSIDPALKLIVSSGFDAVYSIGPSWLSDYSESLYDFLKAFVLPYKQHFFYLSVFSFVLLLLILLLERFGRRFWCRNLCPLGGLLALLARISLFKRVPATSCRHCGMCTTDCRMAAFDENRHFMIEECTLCMDCLDFCPEKITRFEFALPIRRPAPVDINRRQMLVAGMAGVALPVLMKTNAVSKETGDAIIRPPGALDEPAFSAMCVRCGECMKVCINNALQPLFFEKGLEGMFTPALIPRLGYCEFNCTLCSQVCPTGAIETLTLKQKHAFVIGRAVLDKNKCLAYADKKECIVCEEHCPTHDKAIKFTTTEIKDFNENKIKLQQPYIIESLCIGCGICENICPVQGKAAIRVVGKSKKRGGNSY